MRPPARIREDRERLPVDEWLPGVIQDIVYDAEREWTWEGKTTKAPSLRFKFVFEEYKEPHYSNWMKFSLGEKTRLYKKYISSLVEGAYPYADFDFDALKGLPVKVMWTNREEYQNVEMIRPVGDKLKVKFFSKSEAKSEAAPKGTPKAAPKFADIDDEVEEIEDTAAQEEIPF